MNGSEGGQQHGAKAVEANDSKVRDTGMKHEVTRLMIAHRAWEKMTWKRSGTTAHSPDAKDIREAAAGEEGEECQWGLGTLATP